MTSCTPDSLDPRFIDFSEPEYRIWTPHLKYGFRVDYVDYVWAIRWLWSEKILRRASATRKKLVYCFRVTSEYSNGIRIRNVSLYLHIEIMKRKGIEPPTPEHVLVDHIDGDTFNCRRDNLQWATYKMNRQRGDKSAKRKPKSSH